MQYLQNMSGKNLDGWRIEIWLAVMHRVGNEVLGYWPENAVLGPLHNKMNPLFGKGNFYFKAVLVLTNNGKMGNIVGAEEIFPSDLKAFRKKAIAKAKAKLSREEQALLNTD